MPFSADDYQFMSRAIQLAEKGRYTTRPNPCVGCVLVKGGKIISEGWHYRAGEAHAEIHALQQLPADVKAENITAYVTLEPCAHQGRTGSCAIALADNRRSGISRVVYGMEDPNPLVAGKGFAILRESGCVVDGPLMAEQAAALNQGFIRRMQHQRPWVTAKIATSIDGRTAMASGESQWITGPPARRDVQRLRAQSCGIISGIDSILHDNSRLNVRREDSDLPNIDDVLQHPPLRVLLDTQLRITAGDNLSSNIFDPSLAANVVVFTSTEVADDKVAQVLSLNDSAVGESPESQARITVERVETNKVGRLDLEQVLSVLATRYECNTILVETGATLLGGFLGAGLVDELIIYQAPVLLGSDARALANVSLTSMQEKLALTVTDRRMIGDDLRITARFERNSRHSM
jgi:diaminohydroxyphosphoribosylaminopyrimidine deaminase/5-amino-6-(5-phosphoribosylamino)uracil reductase